MLTRRVVILATVLALSGCASAPGGGSGTLAPTSADAATSAAATGPAAALLAAEPCLDARSARVLSGSPPGSLAVLEGDPSSGVAVLSNMTTDALCEWQPLASALRARGVAVLRWDYGTADPQPELARLVAEVRRRGAPRVVLVGASVGGAYSVLASASLRPAVDGVASVSGALPIRSTLQVEPAARRLRGPVLLAGAEQDAGPTVRSWSRAATRAQVRTLLVPGLRHGTALLTGPSAARVLVPVTAWVTARLLG